MLKPLIRLALHLNFSATLRAATKLEYGAGIFCFKMAIRAQDEGYLNLAQFLKRQFTEEDSHARMLGGLVDGATRVKRNCPGGLVTIIDGRHYDYEAFDGISQRYWAAKLFFWFEKPEGFDWVDILAFMSVVESQVAKFYEVLGEYEDTSVAIIAKKILTNENEHADYLKQCIACFHSNPEGVYMKWKNRIILAWVGGIIDLIKYIK
ncbi:MAG: ferritin-like domain-containing protein [Gloeotrichia echinulata GP01]